jgi:hypothetical protein
MLSLREPRTSPVRWDGNVTQTPSLSSARDHEPQRPSHLGGRGHTRILQCSRVTTAASRRRRRRLPPPMRPRIPRPIPRRRCCVPRQLNTDTGYRLGMDARPGGPLASRPSVRPRQTAEKTPPLSLYKHVPGSLGLLRTGASVPGVPEGPGRQAGKAQAARRAAMASDAPDVPALVTIGASPTPDR